MTTLVKTLATSLLLQTLFVLVSLVHITHVDMHWKESVFKDQTGISIYGLHMVSTGLTLEKAKAAGYNATETGFNDLQKPEFMKHDNHEVAIKIVFDKDSREILGAQMVSHDSAISMGIHMFSLAIQEHVTIDKLALTDLFFLPHFNKPYNYITMAALTAEK